MNCAGTEANHGRRYVIAVGFDSCEFFGCRTAGAVACYTSRGDCVWQRKSQASVWLKMKNFTGYSHNF